MMGIAAEWQFVVTGIVLLLAVVIDNIRRVRLVLPIQFTHRGPTSVHPRKGMTPPPHEKVPMRPIGCIFAAAAVGSMALGLAACTTSSDSRSATDTADR